MTCSGSGGFGESPVVCGFPIITICPTPCCSLPTVCCSRIHPDNSTVLLPSQRGIGRSRCADVVRPHRRCCAQGSAMLPQTFLHMICSRSMMNALSIDLPYLFRLVFAYRTLKYLGSLLYCFPVVGSTGSEMASFTFTQKA